MGHAVGANETTNIDDMATTAIKVGTGALLSKSSYQAMTAPESAWLRAKEANCAPMFHAGQRIQLRPRRCALRILAAAGPAP